MWHRNDYIIVICQGKYVVVITEHIITISCYSIMLSYLIYPIKLVAKWQKFVTQHLLPWRSLRWWLSGHHSVGNCMFKVNNRNTRTRHINNRRQWRRSGVFIVNFEHTSHHVLVFLLLTLSKQMPLGRTGLFLKASGAELLWASNILLARDCKLLW